MAEEAVAHGYPFPYLFDADQSLARSLQSACTPEFYLFDANGKLTYRGSWKRGSQRRTRRPQSGRSHAERKTASRPPSPQYRL
jgi:hypothetical protein